MPDWLVQSRQIGLVGWMLARRSLVVELRSARLGWLWPLVYPVLYTTFFMTLKPLLQPTRPFDPDYLLHVFVGLCLWQLWFEGLQTQMRAVKAQRALISRADLDPGALFLSGFLVQAVYLLPRLALALALAALIGRLSAFWPATVFVLMSIVVILNGAVIGFVLQPFATLLPDIARVIQSASLALMLSGGVFLVFPRELSEPMSLLLSLNPLGPLLDAARAPLLGQAPHFSVASWVWIGLTLTALVVQVRLMRKVLPILLERVGG